MPKQDKKTYKEGSTSSVPDFYRSLTNNQKQEKFKYKIDVKQNTPKLAEMIRGQMPIAKYTIVSVNTHMIPFRAAYSKVPLVLGMIETPSGNVKQLPYVLGETEYAYITNITESYMEVKFKCSDDLNKTSIKYVFAVYDLGL